MAEINLPFLMSFNDTVTTIFNSRMETAPTVYGRFCMDVPSGSRENVYPRMEDIPGLREWIGDRVVHSLAACRIGVVGQVCGGWSGEVQATCRRCSRLQL